MRLASSVRVIKIYRIAHGIFRLSKSHVRTLLYSNFEYLMLRVATLKIK